MRPGVHLTLNESNLYSCDGMWQGIFLNDDCQITTLNNTRIEDAETAINSTDKSENVLFIDDTHFNRNRICIYLAKNINVGFSSDAVIGSFNNNKFTCTSPLSSGNNEITKSGIEAIRHPLVFNFSNNIFEGLEYGILTTLNFSVETFISGRNIRFKQIRKDGINLVSGSVKLDGSTFENCGENGLRVQTAKDILLNKNCLFLFENLIDKSSVFANGINIRRFVDGANFGIKSTDFMDRTTHFSVQDPNQKIVTCIQFSTTLPNSNSNVSISIFDCDFTFDSNRTTGINLQGDYTDNSEIDITFNRFTFGPSLEEGGNSEGIVILGEKNNLSIIDNEFRGLGTNGSVLNNCIALSSSEGVNNEVSDNTFISDFLIDVNAGVILPILHDCIRISNFDNTRFCSNENINARRMFVFNGLNMGTDLIANSGQLGILIRINDGGFIGNQFFKGNSWEPLFINGTPAGVPVQAACDPQTADLQRFRVHTEQSVSYNGVWNPFHPVTIDPDLNDEWWRFFNGTAPSECSVQLQDLPNGNNALFLAAEENSLDNYFNSSEEIWNVERDIYFNISKNTNIISSNPGLNSFFNSERVSTIKNFHKINSLLYEASKLEDNVDLLALAKSINDNISSSLIPVLNEKYLNNIKIKIAQNPDYVISSEEESELIEIAEQCIRIGGNSVQKATFLLPPCLNINRNSCDDYDEPAPLIYSNNENLEPIEYETNFKKNNIDVNIYPNPANKFVNIEVEGLASMELFNSSSILLKKYEFYNTNSFDLSELPEGVYYCQIRLESGDSVLKKLVIVK